MVLQSTRIGHISWTSASPTWPCWTARPTGATCWSRTARRARSATWSRLAKASPAATRRRRSTRSASRCSTPKVAGVACIAAGSACLCACFCWALPCGPDTWWRHGWPTIGTTKPTWPVARCWALRWHWFCCWDGTVRWARITMPRWHDFVLNEVFNENSLFSHELFV